MTEQVPTGLLDAARDGDPQALSRLLVVCRPDLTRYARHACQSEDVEEAVQDALWLLYRRVGALRVGAALSGWMFQVVRRLCLRFTRQRVARDRLLGHELHDDMAANAVQDGLRLDLVAAIRQLPASCRDVLLLRDIGGFETAEVAARLGISVEATKSRLHRARLLVRDRLRPTTPGSAAMSTATEPSPP